jgi:ABC-2 type transport system ATP-binding protein
MAEYAKNNFNNCHADDVAALVVHDLKKTYKNGIEALKGVDFSVDHGDFFALLGPNGAGKSTAIGIVCSLVNKTSGQVQVFGHDLDKENVLVKCHIGVVPQEFNFPVFEKVYRIVLDQAGYYGIERSVAAARAEKYLKQLGLWEKRDQAARALSGGMKRRLMIARGLIHEPRLLILDEPTAGVDLELRLSMWDFIREINAEGTTIILTTHYLEEAEALCRNIAIIDHGSIIEHSTMSALLKKLQAETFVLYLTEAITELPSLAEFPCRLVEPTVLHVDVQQQQSMNDLFDLLTRENIKVDRMRNKSNRLEELFLRLTKRHNMKGGLIN